MKKKIVSLSVVIIILTISWFMGSKPAVPVDDKNTINNEKQVNKDDSDIDIEIVDNIDKNVEKQEQNKDLNNINDKDNNIENQQIAKSEESNIENQEDISELDNADDTNETDNENNEVSGSQIDETPKITDDDIKQESVQPEEKQHVPDIEQKDKPTNDTEPTDDVEKVSKESTINDDTDSVPTETKDNEQDEYLTDPVPEGKPQPLEPQEADVNESKSFELELAVRCDILLSNMNLLDKNKLELVPQDGMIFATKKVTAYEGESVFDVLLREMKNAKIHMEFVKTPMYNSAYIEGINNIYEFDAGDLSGWMYKVNDWFPNYGCSRYQVKENDKIEWIYTCDLGRDIGGDVSGGSFQ
ncbi:hypothetical protein SH1V18_04930 [Vallitalea longa]|uniref:Transcobalamin-like C-terminal domain-containing protein n=1 Tax=Vallitalea longa TaxID=2936439 RepID=A0A9W5Y917_9FIRM|nr:DUF4430 domain-containing protein [Vallitalea longa]GKX28013.1 hypothetical protein SH1V18_04930 [Vallitalea longa]